MSPGKILPRVGPSMTSSPGATPSRLTTGTMPPITIGNCTRPPFSSSSPLSGASDAPLKGEELEKGGLVQFPMVMGGIVPVVNLDGVAPGELVIDGPTLGKIFLGEIKTWDDPALKKLNPSAKLTSQAIVVVHRSDGSGTTFNFTDYLSKVN